VHFKDIKPIHNLTLTSLSITHYFAKHILTNSLEKLLYYYPSISQLAQKELYGSERFWYES